MNTSYLALLNFNQPSVVSICPAESVRGYSTNGLRLNNKKRFRVCTKIATEHGGESNRIMLCECISSDSLPTRRASSPACAKYDSNPTFLQDCWLGSLLQANIPQMIHYRFLHRH